MGVQQSATHLTHVSGVQLGR